MSMYIGKRTRHAQHFDNEGNWIRGWWRVINGVPYKFGKTVNKEGRTTLYVLSMTGPYSHFWHFEKDGHGSFLEQTVRTQADPTDHDASDTHPSVD